jgi:hypothetical protein
MSEAKSYTSIPPICLHGVNKDSFELYVPTNALRQFFHCFLYYKDAPIRISAVILPSSGDILSEFLHRPILWLQWASICYHIV